MAHAAYPLDHPARGEHAASADSSRPELTMVEPTRMGSIEITNPPVPVTRVPAAPHGRSPGPMRPMPPSLTGPVRTVRAAALGALLILAASCGTRGAAPPPRALWLYYGVNLGDSQSYGRLVPVWRRAAAAGYTKVVVADTKFARLGQMESPYFENVRRVRSLADSLGLEIIPCVFQVGRSNSMLALDPNLAEGLPVVDARFEIRHGIAVLVPDPPVAFAGRPGWVDPEVRLSGDRAEIQENRRHARWRYDLPVHPHRCYHISVEIRTTGFSGTPVIQVLAGDRVIHFVRRLGVAPAQDWTEHHLVFNSLEYDRLTVWFGVWKASRGTVEWRNWRIEEAGPVNVLRRRGAPFSVRREDGGGVCVEGRDFEPVRDPALGVSPWPGQYQAWHQAPVIRTRLPEGTRLRVSWQHAALVYEGQAACCLSESATVAILADEARRMREAWGARRYLMMFDEIRAMNRDSACLVRRLTPGEILARAARTCAALMPGCSLYVWNDMFDPSHNAVRDYFLVNGDLAGAWDGLRPGIGIVNWNTERARESLRFFSGRGHRQVLAAYYDGAPADVVKFLRAADGVEGVEAVMYTTWRGAYDDLEAFARACGVEPRQGR
jgi:hypothetical protein